MMREMGVPDHCLDAETLAAWSEGGLRGDEHARVEQHLADCARCQTMLAVFARTADAVGAAPAPRRLWSSSWPGWLIPIGAVAALGIVIWIGRPFGTRPVPADQVARVEPPAPTSEPAQPVGTVPAPAVAERARQEAQEPQRSQLSQAPQAPSSQPSAASAARQRAAEASVAPSTAPPAAPSAAPVLVAPAAAPPATTAQEAAKSVAETVTVTGEQPTAAPIEIVPPAVGVQAAAPAGGAGRGGGRLAAPAAGGAVGGVAGGVAADAVRPVPVSPVRWRILASGRVERSVDVGASWDMVPIAPPAVIMAGSSPAPSICWLAGRGGVVLLTVDGQTFQRLMFPEVIDLTSIRATSAVRATVTTADGRMLTTTDRGATWR